MSPSATFRVFAALALLLVLAAYWPSLHAPYYLDDEHNIVTNAKTRIRHVLDVETLTGPQARVDGARLLAYWSFGLHRLVTGVDDPAPLRLVNFFLHLVNAGLVYALCILLLTAPGGDAAGARSTALAAAALWALHPINSQSVIYVVQRMNLLAAGFSLGAVCLYLYGRRRRGRGRWLSWSLIPVAVALGMTGKQNAVMTPLGILTVEYYSLLSAPDTDRQILRRHSRYLVGGTLITAFVFLAGFFAFRDRLTAGFDLRPFTAAQRMWTQGRVLLSYLGDLALPVPARLHLINDIRHSAGPLEPPVTLLAWAAIFLILALAVCFRKKNPLAPAAVLWFLAFHALEAGPLPLELVYEHRNYLPSVLPCLWFMDLLRRHLVSGRRFAGAAVFLCLTMGLLLGVRSHQWTDPVALVERDLAAYPQSARLALWRANLLRERGREPEAYRFLQRFLRETPRPVEHGRGHGMAEILISLGNMESTRGAFARAEQHYRRALGLVPGHQMALYNLALTYLDMDRPEDALRVLLDLERMDPGWPRLQAQKDRAAALLKKKRASP